MKHYIYLFAIALTLSIFMGACSNDEPSEPNNPEQPEQPDEPITPTTGTLVMEMGGDIATAENPALATSESPTEIIIRQQCSYQDPDGSTYSCEPKASIVLTVQNDTIRANTLAELLTIAERSENSNSGTNPLTRRTQQTFNVGGQLVDFALVHEIYTYETSTHKKIEMPYVKLNPARHGKAESKAQTRSSGGASAAITGIRLVPLAATRGSYITEEAYEVNVSFTVEAEAVHTDVAQQQTLSFEVQYIGIVETTTEYPDPVASLTYHTDVLGGTDSSKSPYSMKGDVQEMTLQWLQQSSYTWFDTEQMATQMVDRAPTAHVRVSLGVERPKIILDSGVLIVDLTSLPKGDHTMDMTAYVPSETQTKTEGRVTSSRRDLTISGVPLSVEWDYETCEDAIVDGNVVAMPYMMLGEPQVVDVNIRKEEQLYWYAQEHPLNEIQSIFAVTARIRQTLTKCNTTDAGEDIVEYEVTFLVLQAIPLVQVEYRREVKWTDSYANILLYHSDYVYRDRLYANGEKYTDSYLLGEMGVDGMFATVHSSLEGWRYYYHWTDNEDLDQVAHNQVAHIWMDYIGLIPSNPWDERYEECNDSVYIQHAYLGIPDFTDMSDRGLDDDNYWDVYPDDWNSYLYAASLPVRRDLDLDGVTVIGSEGTTDKPDGAYQCYVRGDRIDRRYRWRYDSGKPRINTDIERYETIPGYYNIEHEISLPASATAWVIDGQRITFFDMIGEYQYNNHTEYLQATEERGPAKVITSEGKVNFLGKNFYSAVVDTIYQIKGSGRPYEARRKAPQHSAMRSLRSAPPMQKRKNQEFKANVVIENSPSDHTLYPKSKSVR